MTKRVVITGMGAVTPIGLSVEESWEALRRGKTESIRLPVLIQKSRRALWERR